MHTVIPSKRKNYFQTDASSVLYLAKGHLTANADFVYNAQQAATFLFENAAPQWQTLNNGNWKVLEDRLRTYTSSQRNDLHVYTGTSGITTLKTENGDEKPIYLQSPQIRAPKYYWKVVYDPIKKQGGLSIH